MAAPALTVDRLHVRYHLADPADAPRLDACLARMATEHLADALAIVSLPPATHVCMPSLSVPLAMDARGAPSGLTRHWARAIAGAVGEAARDPGPEVVVYARTLDALVDLVTSVARGDHRRAWAWRQTGVSAAPMPGPADVAAALAARPGEAPAALRAAAGRGPVPLAPDGWRMVARAVEALVPRPVPEAGSAREDDVALAAAIARHPLGRAMPGLAVDDPASTSLATLAVACLAPSRSRSGALVAEVARALAAAEPRSHRPRAPGPPGPAVLPSITAEPPPVDGPPGSPESSSATPERPPAARESAGVAGAPGSASAAPGVAGAPGSASVARGSAGVAGAPGSVSVAPGAAGVAGAPGSVSVAPGAAGVAGAPGSASVAPGPAGIAGPPGSAPATPDPAPLPGPPAPSSAPPGPVAVASGPPESLPAGPEPQPAVAAGSGVPAPDPAASTGYGGLLYLIPALTALDLPTALDRWAWSDVVAALAGRLAGVASRDPAVTALGGPGDHEPRPVPEETVEAAASGLDGWLRDALGAGPGADLGWLWQRDAAIVAEPGWVEATFPLDSVDTRVRRAGLDLDPGFVWWLGAVVRFRYE